MVLLTTLKGKTTMTEAVFLSVIAVAMVMVFGFVLWNAVMATNAMVGDSSVSEKRKVNRKLEAMARERRRHDRAMRRIRKRRR